MTTFEWVTTFGLGFLAGVAFCMALVLGGVLWFGGDA